MSASSFIINLHCPVFTGFDASRPAKADEFDRVSLRSAFLDGLQPHIRSGAVVIENEGFGAVMSADRTKAVETLVLRPGTIGADGLLACVRSAFAHTVLGHRELVIRKGEQVLRLVPAASLEFVQN